MQLQELLYTQGFGTRRLCQGLIEKGHVRVGGRVCLDPFEDVEPQGARFEVDGVVWPYQARAYVMLHKPAGYECSRKPSAWPSVLTLLPAPLRQRPVRGAHDGVQPVGRLDQDTTGLLLLTDDGRFIHRMNSPRHLVPKRYVVRARHPVSDSAIERLLAGVVLDDDPVPVKATHCERLGSHEIALTLTQGKYHQVKRMLAAVGNRVEGLHRSHVGALGLPVDLAPGQWRWIEAGELDALNS